MSLIYGPVHRVCCSLFPVIKLSGEVRLKLSLKFGVKLNCFNFTPNFFGEDKAIRTNFSQRS